MSLAWNVFTTLSARVMLLGVALASSVALARMLGPEGRGLFALILLLPDLARTFAMLGFDQANTVYAGLEPRGRRALVWHSALVAGLLGGLITAGGVAYLAMAGPGSQTFVRGPLWLYIVPLSIVPAAIAAEHWTSIVRGMNHITLVNALEVGAKIAALVLLLALVGGLGLGVAGAVWADALVNIAATGAAVLALRSTGLWSRPCFDWALFRRTVRFAVPSYAGTLMNYLNYRVDQFIVAAFLPPDQLAYYVIAVGLAERLWILTGAVAGPLLPHLTNTPSRDPALSAVVARHVLVWTTAAGVVVLILADVIINILYSSDYAAAATPLRWLVVGIVTLSVGKILVAELLARTKIMFTLWVAAIVASVNIGGNILLVPQMGITGAAIASTVSYTLLSVIVVWYYLRETRVPWTMLLPRTADARVYAAIGRRMAQLTMPGATAPGKLGP